MEVTLASHRLGYTVARQPDNQHERTMLTGSLENLTSGESRPMALDEQLSAELSKNDWFKSHPVAWAIVDKGPQLLASDKKDPRHNVQCMLSNMSAYGLTNWQYEPGSPTNADRVLKGEMAVTDCKSLAEIFVLLVKNAGLEEGIGPIKAEQIKKDGYRIVTKPGLCTFKNKPGSASLQGRWCFGDHWVATIGGLSYDPTFRIPGFAGQHPQLDWYAQEDRKCPEALGTKIKTVYKHPTDKTKYVYMRMDGEYTFNPKDPMV